MRLVRRDAIHKDVVKNYRNLGVQFLDVSHFGGLGCDLFARHVFTGEMLAIELKDGALPPSRRELTDSEERLKMLFPGSFRVALSVAEALAVVGLAPVPLTADHSRKML